MTLGQQALDLESPPGGETFRVYVDAAIWPYGRMIMCHMIADRLEDLHEMADRIGIARRWFQQKPGGVPHYDICKSKRVLAIEHGAVEVSAKEFCDVCRRHGWMQPR